MLLNLLIGALKCQSIPFCMCLFGYHSCFGAVKMTRRPMFKLRYWESHIFFRERRVVYWWIICWCLTEWCLIEIDFCVEK